MAEAIRKATRMRYRLTLRSAHRVPSSARDSMRASTSAGAGRKSLGTRPEAEDRCQARPSRTKTVRPISQERRRLGVWPLVSREEGRVMPGRPPRRPAGWLGGSLQGFDESRVEQWGGRHRLRQQGGVAGGLGDVAQADSDEFALHPQVALVVGQGIELHAGEGG